MPGGGSGRGHSGLIQQARECTAYPICIIPVRLLIDRTRHIGWQQRRRGAGVVAAREIKADRLALAAGSDCHRSHDRLSDENALCSSLLLRETNRLNKDNCKPAEKLSSAQQIHEIYLGRFWETGICQHFLRHEPQIVSLHETRIGVPLQPR
jgi:hypothetical protein